MVAAVEPTAAETVPGAGSSGPGQAQLSCAVRYAVACRAHAAEPHMEQPHAPGWATPKSHSQPFSLAIRTASARLRAASFWIAVER